MRLALLVLVSAGCAGPGVDLDDVPYGHATPGFRGTLTATGEEFTCEFEEETCPTACDGNQPPVLSEPIYIVNGVRSDAFEAGDHVVVRVPYADPDCNMACGFAGHGFVLPRESMDGGWTLCSNQPCSSDDSEVYLGFVLGVLERNFDYSFWVRLSDGCGGESERIAEEFSL